MTFGTLAPALADTPEAGNVLAPAGPVSEAFIMAREPVALIVGPQGGGKTVATIKKIFLETARMPPWSRTFLDGSRPEAFAGMQTPLVRRYTLGCWRRTYRQQWDTTIKSWLRIVPKAAGAWNGSPPGPADHVIRWRDGAGWCETIVMFRAFDDVADANDLRGYELTDCWLNEWDTLSPELFMALAGRVARAPTRPILGRPGRIFGDTNAPVPGSDTYRTFYEDPPAGHRLYRQPGGLSPGAENRAHASREYYLDMIAKNARRPNWIKRMVHAQPAYDDESDIVFPEFDDDFHRSETTLEAYKELTVVWGFDGGLKPAGIAMQEMADGQLRWLAEVALKRGSELELAAACKAVMAEPRFKGCSHVGYCDPAMNAGDDTKLRSMRTRLAGAIGIPIHVVADTANRPDQRIGAVRPYLERRLSFGRPAFVLDPSAIACRRGFNGTYKWRLIAGTTVRSGLAKNDDSNPMDAGCYGTMSLGVAGAGERIEDRKRRQRERREAGRQGGAYNPLGRW